MITREIVEAVVAHSKRLDTHRKWAVYREWRSNGAVAIRAPWWQPSDAYESPAFGRNLDEILASTRMPVREDESLRIPNKLVTRTEYYDACEGCECGACEGTRGVPHEVVDVHVGQRVYVTESGESLVVDPDYAALLEGLNVVAVTAPSYSSGVVPAIAGIDASGELVAIVMKRIGDVRQPEVTP